MIPGQGVASSGPAPKRASHRSQQHHPSSRSAVSAQVLRRPSQRVAVLSDGRENDLAVGLQLVGGRLERVVPVVTRHREDHVAARKELGRGELTGLAVLARGGWEASGLRCEHTFV